MRIFILVFIFVSLSLNVLAKWNCYIIIVRPSPPDTIIFASFNDTIYFARNDSVILRAFAKSIVGDTDTPSVQWFLNNDTVNIIPQKQMTFRDTGVVTYYGHDAPHVHLLYLPDVIDSVRAITVPPDLSRQMKLLNNPVHDILTLKTSADNVIIECSIEDVSGKRIWREKLNTGYEGQLNMDVTQLKSGIFIITVIQGNITNTWKFIKS